MLIPGSHMAVAGRPIFEYGDATPSVPGLDG
jgi:hypothetical protein